MSDYKVNPQTVNRFSSRMKGHAPKRALPAGDNYGVGIKNPTCKSRDSSFGSSVPLKSRKNGKPTALA